MDIAVRTGQTRSPKDLLLISLSEQSLRGEPVCLLMEVVGKDDAAKTVARECESVMRHAILDTDGDAAERLDGALKELNGLLKGMLISGAVQDIHMLIGIVSNDRFLHVSHAGRSEAYLVRKGVASQVTEYSTGKPTPAFVHIASGKIEQGDVIIFSTERLLRSLTPAQLSRIASNRDTLIDVLERTLETEGEHAALVTMDVPRDSTVADHEDERDRPSPRPNMRRSARRDTSWKARARAMMPDFSMLQSVFASVPTFTNLKKKASKKSAASVSVLSRLLSSAWVTIMKERLQTVISDLHHPERKKRAHLLLIASALAILIVLWAFVHLLTIGQRSKTKADLEALVEQINTEMQTAENRRIIGDSDAANAILDKAAEQAKQVMDNQSGMFRQEAYNLLDRIRSKKEEINNIMRVSPRVVANLSTKAPNISASGLVGLDDGEFVAYDKEDAYHVFLNSVEEPHRIGDGAFIIDGANLSRFQSQAFLMSGNGLMEWNNGQATSMKTDDPRGWMSGNAIAGYLRFLYVLSPDNKQIYKYERLTNRYGVPVEYNVNGDLTDAIDMTIDGSVYVLKQDGTLLKLFRGETQPFVIRKAPTGLLKDATKLLKVTDRNFYILDPVHARVIMISDGGVTGEASYVKQFVIEGEQVGTLQDLYVDPDEAHLYVMDDKRIYVVDLNTK